MAEGDNTTVSAEEYNKLKTQVQNWQAKATDYEKRFAGIDPDAVKAKLEDYELLRKESAKTDPDKFDKWAKSESDKIRSEIAKELKEARELADRYGRENKELKVTDRVFATISPKFNPDTADIIKDYTRRYCDIDDTGSIIIKDDNGKERYKDGNVRMTAEDFGTWLANKYPSLATATFKPGTQQPGKEGKADTLAPTPLMP
jgi:DNA-directed RNA polymerase subunit F